MDQARPHQTPVATPRDGTVVMFHKPKGLVVTRSDERGRRTVFDALPPAFRDNGWIPVGRLDLETRGLLLFVQDGVLMDRLSRPGAHHKTYHLTVRGRVTPEHLQRIASGIPSPVGVLSAVSARVLREIGPKTDVEVVLDEGKNRHIRRMFAALLDPKHGTSLKVLELRRVAFGPIQLDVALGEWRELTREEAAALTTRQPSRRAVPADQRKNYGRAQNSPADARSPLR